MLRDDPFNLLSTVGIEFLPSFDRDTSLVTFGFVVSLRNEVFVRNRRNFGS